MAFSILVKAPGDIPRLVKHTPKKLASALAYAKRTCKSGDFVEATVVGSGGYEKTIRCKLNARASRAHAEMAALAVKHYRG
ncbi:MAG: hypothetical protein IPJ61_19265 [Tessaracoccus sp.]|jgi:hypothetical protein|uniref:hypothetical protein n=1 Tax=Tessaracoccus sp. TaxID=1971211 RepID=UPI001ECB70CC|nr:hypothetical protein [Tessaracoccus sp.]MBK7823128.1 hypothetical protein [Tessaracoccus sp.]